MSRRVSDDRLEVIHLHLSRAIRKKEGVQWLTVGGVEVCDGHDLIALLDELKRRRSTNGTTGRFLLGETTRTLMAMKVGDEVEIDPISQSKLTTARRTARKNMLNPNAVWRSYLLDNGRHRIVRAPDGSPINEKRHNPAVYVMAKMLVGHVVTISTLKGKMHNGIKTTARNLMKNTAADWRCTNLANGDVRCTRVR